MFPQALCQSTMPRNFACGSTHAVVGPLACVTTKGSSWTISGAVRRTWRRGPLAVGFAFHVVFNQAVNILISSSEILLVLLLLLLLLLLCGCSCGCSRSRCGPGRGRVPLLLSLSWLLWLSWSWSWPSSWLSPVLSLSLRSSWPLSSLSHDTGENKRDFRRDFGNSALVLQMIGAVRC